MKNRIIYGTSIIAIVAFILACQKIENTPSYPASKVTFAVSTSVQSVAVSATDSLSTAITFNWNDPKFAVGLSNSKFTLMIDSAGKNFVRFDSKVFTDTIKGSLSGKELNAIAMKAGGKISQPITLEAKVVASTSNNNEPISSAVITFIVTPYGDLNLSATSTAVVCTAATATDIADTLSWNQAFNGYSGVKMYSIQYAKGGTSFASPTTISVSTFTKTFTKRELNQMAESVGVAAGTTGDVDFRIKATNESGTILYSNTKTVSVTTYVAYNSIGLIGDFTGWGNDVDLYRPDPVNAPGTWTATLYITGGGGVKFRADDAWSDNWGDTAFPSGTGVSNSPNNIPVSSSGYYQVNFNSVSAAYTFTALAAPTYTNISLIGDFNGWGADSDLTVDGTGHIWTGTVSIGSTGSLKFRANHDWTVSWGGATTFPSGYSFASNNNIAVPAGTYFVWFNDVSGEYMFGPTANSSPYTSVGLIGDFNGWGADSNLIKNPSNPYKWSLKLTLPAGALKFRANAAWTVNWGSSAFPNGVGVQDSPDNIPTTAGTFQITLNSLTGEYTFDQ